MTVKELRELLETLPPDDTIYVDAGEYKDNYIEACTVGRLNLFGIKGWYIE